MKKTNKEAMNKAREAARAARMEAHAELINELKAAAEAGAAFNPDQIDKIRAAITAGICTDHRGKMYGMMSFSTCCDCNNNCIARMNNPDLICAGCFAHDQQAYQVDQKMKNIRNSELFSEIVIPAAAMPFINAAIFRLESFGDLINETHALNYFTMCNANKRTRFVLWTKNPWLIDRIIKAGHKKPRNLTIIFSSPFMNVQAKSALEKWAFVDKVFTVYRLDHMLNAGMNLKDIDKFINCGSRSCIGCQCCYTVNKTTFINELYKADQKRFEKLQEKAGK